MLRSSDKLLLILLEMLLALLAKASKYIQDRNLDALSYNVD